VAKTAAIETRR